VLNEAEADKRSCQALVDLLKNTLQERGELKPPSRLRGEDSRTF